MSVTKWTIEENENRVGFDFAFVWVLLGQVFCSSVFFLCLLSILVDSSGNLMDAFVHFFEAMFFWVVLNSNTIFSTFASSSEVNIQEMRGRKKMIYGKHVLLMRVNMISLLEYELKSMYNFMNDCWKYVACFTMRALHASNRWILTNVCLFFLSTFEFPSKSGQKVLWLIANFGLYFATYFDDVDQIDDAFRGTICRDVIEYWSPLD